MIVAGRVYDAEQSFFSKNIYGIFVVGKGRDLQRGKMRKLRYDYCALSNNHMLIFLDDKCLISIDTGELKCEFVDYYDVADNKSICPKGNMCSWGDSIVWLGVNGRVLYSWNVYEDYLEKREISFFQNNADVNNLIVQGERLFAFSSMCDGLYEFVPTKNIFEKIAEIEIGEVVSWTVDGDIIVLFMKDGYNLIYPDMRIEKYDIGEKYCIVRGIYDDEIIALTVDGIVLRGKLGDQLEEVATLEDGPASQMIKVGENVIFFPWKGHSIFLMSLINNSFKELFINGEYEYVKSNYYKYNFYCEDEKYIWMSNRLGENPIRVDKVDFSIEKLNYEFPSINSEKEYFEKHDLFLWNEGEYMNLNDFCQICISNKEMF